MHYGKLSERAEEEGVHSLIASGVGDEQQAVDAGGD
jgi:hypothetical protein